MTEQNEDTRGEMVLYQGQDGIVELDVRLETESLWLSLNQIAALFERESRSSPGISATSMQQRN